MEECLMEAGWIFPYDDIEKGSSIILYGAGQIGRCFEKQIRKTGYCYLFLWVDKKAKEYQKEGLDVKSIEAIKQIESIDKVVIAINSKEICFKVEKDLKNYGITSDKIWSPFLHKDGKSGLLDLKKYFYNDICDIHICRNKKIDIHNLNIAFIIPVPIQGGGGHRNIFRVVQHFASKGHKVTVYYTQTEKKEDEIKRCVSEWFYDMQNVTFKMFIGSFEYHDIGIATWWETAYVLNARKNNFQYLFYFVQDYEACFYPMSSDYLLAENSYNLGFFHLCSGRWCKEKIEKKFNAKTTYFQFPVDKEIYYKRRRKKKNRNIIFFAKPEMPRRCFEIGIAALKIFKKKRPDIEIIMYGSQQLVKGSIPFDVTIKRIIPTLDELAEMYSNADIGIVFSTTNPSLVPYEMMSCGCPVIDLDVIRIMSFC